MKNGIVAVALPCDENVVADPWSAKKRKVDRGTRIDKMSFLRKQESIFYLTSDIRLLTSVFWIPDHPVLDTGQE